MYEPIQVSEQGRRMKTVMLRGVEIGAGIPKIAVPIVAPTAEGILDKARELRACRFDVAEWRADYYEDAPDADRTLDTLKRLRAVLGETPILFAFRTKREGGAREITPEDYAALNIAVARSGDADAIDVELLSGGEAARAALEAIHAAGRAVVGSSHDFEKTPDKPELLRRLGAMRDMGADILKIAVMPRSEADVITLLDATQEMHRRCADRPIVTMSMGRGVVSRLCGEYFGSALTFGAVGELSAPGQIPADQLAELLTILHRALESAGP